jgi:hypothetical protein
MTRGDAIFLTLLTLVVGGVFYLVYGKAESFSLVFFGGLFGVLLANAIRK